MIVRMDERDRELRNLTYRRFVELGRAPRLAELAAEAGIEPEELAASWRRLHDEHALVLDPTGEIRMAAPFSAVPTPHRVRAAGRSWFANCAWDAFGVCVALGSDGEISSACPDCGETIEIAFRGGRAEPDEHVVHLLVPAARWWHDIVFT
jgi:Alkylmercury lyase